MSAKIRELFENIVGAKYTRADFTRLKADDFSVLHGFADVDDYSHVGTRNAWEGFQLGYKAAIDAERVKFFALYQAAQALVVRIGATDAYIPEVQAVMDALHDLDGGAPWPSVEAIRQLGGE
jgi:hypothetical protein